MTEELTAFHTAFKEISDECREKSFPLPNSTDFGMGWRSAKEYYTRNDKAVIDEFLAEAYTLYDKYCQCGHIHQASSVLGIPDSCSECDCKGHRYLSRKKAIERAYHNRYGNDNITT